MPRKANAIEAVEAAEANTAPSASNKKTAAEPVTSEAAGTEETINKIVSSIGDIAGPAKEVAPNAVSISRDKEVICRSIRFGGLVYRSEKSGAKFRWPRMGAVETMTFAELQEMHNNKRAYLEKPYLIVDDPDVVRYFRLDETYRKVAQIDDLQDILTKDIGSIDKVLDVILQVGMRDVAISKMRYMRKIGTLTNIDVIKHLEKRLQFDFTDDEGKE